MAFSINEIRAQLQYGGARTSMFQVTITNPVLPAADIKFPFLCESASIPTSEIGVIQVPYFGRFIKIPGDRTFSPWSTTVLNDEDFVIRNSLETWHNAINALERNIATRGAAPTNYKTQATVTQFSKDGSELRTYQLNGFWPSQLSDITLNWGEQNTIERFSCTWEYDNYEIVAGKTGNGGGK